MNQPLGATTMTSRKATAVTVDQRTDTYLPNRGIPPLTDRWSNCGVMTGTTHAARPPGLAHVIGVISARLVPDDGSVYGRRGLAVDVCVHRSGNGTVDGGISTNNLVSAIIPTSSTRLAKHLLKDRAGACC